MNEKMLKILLDRWRDEMNGYSTRAVIEDTMPKEMRIAKLRSRQRARHWTLKSIIVCR
jgi:hypothetical protein